MKITLQIPTAKTRKASTPFPEADHAVVEGACPLCGVEPFKVAGRGVCPSVDDRAWEADASALCCDQHVGTLRVDTNTLFGVREDRAVLQSRCRVY